MTNEEFLLQLEALLRDRLTREELDEVSQYHRDYFDREGPCAAQQLDPPEVIAQRVADTYHPVLAVPDAAPRRRGKSAALIALCAVLLAAGFGLHYGVRHVLHRKVETSVVEVLPESMVKSVTILTVAREELPPFRSIRLEGDAGAVTVKAGDRTAIASENHHDWTYTVEDDVLILTQEDGHHDGEGVELTLADPHLEEIDIETYAGRIFLDGITASSISLGTNAGNIDLKDCSAEDVVLSTDMGSISASLSGEKSDWSLELDANLGTVRVDGEKVRRSYTKNGGGRSLSATTDVGDISVKFVP